MTTTYRDTPPTLGEVLLVLEAAGNDRMRAQFGAMAQLLSKRSYSLSYDAVLALDMDAFTAQFTRMMDQMRPHWEAATSSERVREMLRAAATAPPGDDDE